MQDLAMPAKTLEMYSNKSEVGQNLAQNKVTKDERFSIAAHCKTFGIEKEKFESKKSKTVGFLPGFPSTLSYDSTTEILSFSLEEEENFHRTVVHCIGVPESQIVLT